MSDGMGDRMGDRMKKEICENMISGLTIAPIQEEDIPILAEIEAKSFSMPWSPEDFRDLLSIDYAYYLVAKIDGQVVGSLGMRILAGEGNIDNVVVDEDFRCRGIASALLSRLLEEGEKMGVKDYTLEVRVSNEPAIKVYEKFGFIREGIRPRFYEQPVEDAAIYWRRGE